MDPKWSLADTSQKAIKMSYWSTTLERWWDYVWPYFVISIVGTIIFGFLIVDRPGAIYELGREILGDFRKGAPLAFAVICLGPLFNVYTTVISAKSAVEADDDYHFSLNELTHLPKPSEKSRKRLKATLTLAPALMLLPFTFWIYTAPINWLWMPAQPVYSQPGLFASLGLILLLYYFVPKVFPSAVDAAFDLEDRITERLGRE